MSESVIEKKRFFRDYLIPRARSPLVSFTLGTGVGIIYNRVATRYYKKQFVRTNVASHYVSQMGGIAKNSSEQFRIARYIFVSRKTQTLTAIVTGVSAILIDATLCSAKKWFEETEMGIPHLDDWKWLLSDYFFSASVSTLVPTLFLPMGFVGTRRICFVRFAKAFTVPSKARKHRFPDMPHRLDRHKFLQARKSFVRLKTGSRPIIAGTIMTFIAEGFFGAIREHHSRMETQRLKLRLAALGERLEQESIDNLTLRYNEILEQMQSEDSGRKP